MVEENRQAFEDLALDPDESQHMALIPASTQARLLLANEGAKLTLIVVRQAGTRHSHGSPPFFVLRSLVRVANLLRLALIGLELGYYAGATSVMRMAYESLLYAFLFNRYPDKALSWLRLTFDTHMDREESIAEEQQLRSLAKHTFNEWTGERDLGQQIWERASELIHHTAEGLAAESGLEPWQLLSEELAKALEATGGDFDLAIRLAGLQARFGTARVHAEPVERTGSGMPWTGEFGGLYDEEWLDLWSIVLLYLVHRVTDFTYQTFPPHDKGTKDAYKGWHETVKTRDWDEHRGPKAEDNSNSFG
jgi:hypothetical protein